MNGKQVPPGMINAPLPGTIPPIRRSIATAKANIDNLCIEFYPANR